MKQLKQRRWRLVLAAACAARRRAATAPAHRRRLPLPRQPVLYTDHVTAKEANDKGCRTIEGAPITVMQTVKPRRAPCRERASAARRPARSRVDRRQRARDSDARRILEAELRREEEQARRAEEGVQQRRARAAGRRAQLPEVPRPRRRDEGRHRAQGKRHRRHQARARQAAAVSAGAPSPPRAALAAAPTGPRLRGASTCSRRWSPWSRPTARCLFANAAFEHVLGLSRRSVLRGSLFDWFIEPQALRDTVAAVSQQRVLDQPLRGAAAGRRRRCTRETLPVHVIVNQIEPGGAVLVELVEIEQQTRQDREERALDQAQANKELIRNLAHEIKNPLGGIRGAAQLLRDGGRVARPDRVHAGHHQRGRPPAGAGRPAARAAPPAARRRRRQHPRGLRAGALADPGRVSARPAGRARLRHLDPRVPRRPRAADPGGAEHRAQRRAGAGRAHRGGRCAASCCARASRAR